jgi:thioredoxin 1
VDDPELEAIRKRKMAALIERGSRAAADGKPAHIDEAEFESFVKAHPLVLMDFWADWCRPCHMIAPFVEEIARENAARLAVAKVDIDRNRGLQRLFSVSGIPTLVLLKDGKEVARQVGAGPKSSLSSMLEPFLRGDGGGEG